MILGVLTAILGFASPFLPALLNYFTKKQDNAHETEMFELRLKLGQNEHDWKMSEIESQADIAEAQVLHQPMTSFGVQLLDAAKGIHPVLFYPAFYLFVLLDFISALVRPAITYAFVSFYMLYKWSLFASMRAVSDATFHWWEGVGNIWGDQDFAMLTLVVSYWFGHRAAKAAFGGNATSGIPGK